MKERIKEVVKVYLESIGIDKIVVEKKLKDTIAHQYAFH